MFSYCLHIRFRFKYTQTVDSNAFTFRLIQTLYSTTEGDDDDGGDDDAERDAFGFVRVFVRVVGSNVRPAGCARGV